MPCARWCAANGATRRQPRQAADVGKLQENFEVHLFDFHGDLYGQTFGALIDFIRPEMKFPLDALKARSPPTERRHKISYERTIISPEIAVSQVSLSQSFIMPSLDLDAQMEVRFMLRCAFSGGLQEKSFKCSSLGRQRSCCGANF